MLNKDYQELTCCIEHLSRTMIKAFGDGIATHEEYEALFYEDGKFSLVDVMRAMAVMLVNTVDKLSGKDVIMTSTRI